MTLSILLQAAQGGQQGGGMMSILMIVALIAIFYFFMILPQNKKQKKMREFRNSLEKGSKVVTAGGIHGKVRDVKEDVIVLEVCEGTKITIDKNMVYPSAADADPQAK